MNRLHLERDDHQQDCTWYHLASPRGDLVAKRCSSLSTPRSSPSSCPSPPLLKLFVHCCCNYHLCYLNHHLIISQLPDHLGHLVHLHLTGFCLSCEFIVVWINQHRRPHRLPPHHHQFSSFFERSQPYFDHLEFRLLVVLGLEHLLELVPLLLQPSSQPFVLVTLTYNTTHIMMKIMRAMMMIRPWWWWGDCQMMKVFMIRMTTARKMMMITASNKDDDHNEN